MSTQLRAYLRLTRPPNLLTAVSDIWAGAALSGYFQIENQTILPLILLSLASVFLYAGGVVMNDVCDAKLDARERPERPIPSGKVSKTSALIFGYGLLIIGIILGFIVGKWSGVLAFLIALACLVYDRWGKPRVFWGPVNMGVCRGLNLLLGMSIFSLQYGVGVGYWIAFVPVIYIIAVTLISRGEVHGGNRFDMITALLLYLGVIIVIVVVAGITEQLAITAAFLLLFILFIFPPLFKALKTLSERHVGKAVKAGVLGLILMNACWAAVGAGWAWAIATALLLPVSIWTAKTFAVT